MPLEGRSLRNSQSETILEVWKSVSLEAKKSFEVGPFLQFSFVDWAGKFSAILNHASIGIIFFSGRRWTTFLTKSFFTLYWIFFIDIGLGNNLEGFLKTTLISVQK